MSPSSRSRTSLVSCMGGDPTSEWSLALSHEGVCWVPSYRLFNPKLGSAGTDSSLPRGTNTQYQGTAAAAKSPPGLELSFFLLPIYYSPGLAAYLRFLQCLANSALRFYFFCFPAQANIWLHTNFSTRQPHRPVFSPFFLGGTFPPLQGPGNYPF